MATVAAKVASVGNWVSPITSKMLVTQSKRLGAVTFAPDGRLYWLEGRPEEGGRQVLVSRSPSGVIADVTPPPDSGFNVRTRVHEYGGGDYVTGTSAVYFSNFSDQRLYAQEMSTDGSFGSPQALTPEGNNCRYADGVLDEARRRLIVVCEDHTPKEGSSQPVNTISAVDLESGAVRCLVSGNDFYASPRLSAAGDKLAWVTWNHPDMPWDDTELWMGTIEDDGSIGNQQRVAGGTNESVMQPQWGPDGCLYFITDAPSGWWNIKKRRPDAQVEPVFVASAEVGSPAWLFGNKAYHVLSSGELLVLYSDPNRAGSSVALLDPAASVQSDLPTLYTSFGGQLAVYEGIKITLATVAGSALLPSAVVIAEAQGTAILASAGLIWQVVAKSMDAQVDEGYLTPPRVIEFKTEGGKTAFMNFYAPRNKDFVFPEAEQPPLLIKIHGGPTSQASTAFNLAYQYWTSRGFAIADINYGGSTGYGREYRMRLRKNWGVVDVDDCCNAATHLASEGLVDPARLCITGGSAGGYTTLACLTFKDVFAAGASHYGIGDLQLLAQETHKFESHYTDSLIGEWPQKRGIYEQRSPIYHADKIASPIAFFQGLEDKVVPPNQAELMHSKLKEKKIPTALILFEGEQHGFRGATSIRRALDGEFYFYGRTLGFPVRMPEDLQPLVIDNL